MTVESNTNISGSGISFLVDVNPNLAGLIECLLQFEDALQHELLPSLIRHIRIGRIEVQREVLLPCRIDGTH